MGLKTSDGLRWLSCIILGVWIGSGAVVTFLLLKIDSIVHVQLYEYGLQLSTDWAAPYWTTTQLIYVALGLPMFLSAVVVGLVLIRSRKRVGENFSKPKPNPIEARQKATVAKEPKLQMATLVQEDELVTVGVGNEPEHSEGTEKKPKAQGANGLLISCPSCNKVFNRPLVMLDFSMGKTRLVNICPYCNHTLGAALEQKKSDDSTAL